MDNELFELGEQVFQKLGWVHHTRFIEGKMVYEFTSDYLLEKLPSRIKADSSQYFGPFTFCMVKTDDEYQFGYETIDKNGRKNTQYYQYDSTPLKALLKLTLALHEAGELK